MSWLPNWLEKRLAISIQRPKRAATYRPRLEVLESRQLLALIGLDAPTPIGPSGSIQDAEPTFIWSAVTGADHYDVWVQDQTAGQLTVLRNHAVPGTSWVPTTPLKPGD